MNRSSNLVGPDRVLEGNLQHDDTCLVRDNKFFPVRRPAGKDALAHNLARAFGCFFAHCFDVRQVDALSSCVTSCRRRHEKSSEALDKPQTCHEVVSHYSWFRPARAGRHRTVPDKTHSLFQCRYLLLAALRARPRPQSGPIGLQSGSALVIPKMTGRGAGELHRDHQAHQRPRRADQGARQAAP